MKYNIYLNIIEYITFTFLLLVILFFGQGHLLLSFAIISLIGILIGYQIFQQNKNLHLFRKPLSAIISFVLIMLCAYYLRTYFKICLIILAINILIIGYGIADFLDSLKNNDHKDDKISTLENHNLQLQQSLEQQNIEKQQLSQKIRHINQLHKTLEQDRDTTLSRLNKLEQNKNVNDNQEIENLKKIIQKQNNELDEYNKSLIEASQQLKIHENKILSLSTALLNSEIEKNSLSENISILQSDLAEVKDYNTILQNQINSTKQQIKNIQNERDILQAKITASELDHTQESIDTLQQFREQLEQKDKEIILLKENLKAFNINKMDTDIRIETLNNTIIKDKKILKTKKHYSSLYKNIKIEDRVFKLLENFPQEEKTSFEKKLQIIQQQDFNHLSGYKKIESLNYDCKECYFGYKESKRMYFTIDGNQVNILLINHKDDQQKDIKSLAQIKRG